MSEVKIDDAAVYEVDGEKITGAQLKSQRMLMKDYTVKTQEVAAEKIQLANLRPQVEAVLEQAPKLAQVDEFFKKDPESYTRFAHFQEGKPIPVVDKGGTGRSAGQPEPVQNPNPTPLRDPAYDQKLNSIEMRQAGMQGEMEMRAFSEANGIDLNFVAQEILPIASGEIVSTLPPRVRLERAFEVWKGRNVEKFAAQRIGQRIDASFLGGGGRGPRMIEEQQQAVEKVKENLKSNPKPGWLNGVKKQNV